VFLGRRVDKLQNAGDKRAAFVADTEHYQFRIACSCPPSTTLYMRGGLIYNYDPTGNSWYVDSDAIDFTSDTQFGGVTFNFTNANYYLTGVLLIDFSGNPAPYEYTYYTSSTEHATAAEAEQNLTTYWFNVRAIWGSSYPLCGVILRNDGVTGAGTHILPIDPINRGRSYIWPRDMRPRAIALTG